MGTTRGGNSGSKLLTARLEASLRDEKFLWELITNKYVTLQELRTVYTLDDVFRLYAILNYEADVMEQQRQKTQARKH